MDNQFRDWLTELRREFHQYPEPGWLEYRTTARIAEELTEMGVPFLWGSQILDGDKRMGLPHQAVDSLWRARALDQLNRRAAKLSQGDKRNHYHDWLTEMSGGFTGLMACLEGGQTSERNPGKTVLLRVDMDANDLVESQDMSHRPQQEGFSSLNGDGMHACGHDGHMAIGLGVVKLLVREKDRLTGKIYVLFQPAEERVRGAAALLQCTAVQTADYFLSGHIGLTASENGMLAGATGFLATTKLQVTFTGKAAHAGSAKEQGISAVVAAARAVTALEDWREESITLQKIQPNNHEKSRQKKNLVAFPSGARLNVGMIQGGTAFNIVPEKAVISLETRAADDSTDQELVKQVAVICQQEAIRTGCSCEAVVLGRAGTACCDPELRKQVLELAEKIHYFTDIREELPFAASEDATLLMKEVQSHGGQACYFMLGSRLASGHHSSRFDFDEAVLEPSAQLLAAAAVRLLESSQ